MSWGVDHGKPQVSYLQRITVTEQPIGVWGLFPRKAEDIVSLPGELHIARSLGLVDCKRSVRLFLDPFHRKDVIDVAVSGDYKRQ